MIRCCAVILLMRVSMSTNKMMIPAFLLVFTLVANVQCRAEKSSENGSPCYVLINIQIFCEISYLMYGYLIFCMVCLFFKL